MRACERVGSIDRNGSRSTPGPFRSTRTMQAAPLASTHDTTARSATSPSGTGDFTAGDRTVAQHGRRPASRLGQRGRTDLSAAGQLGKVFFLLIGFAGQLERLGRQIDGRGKRYGRQRATELLGDQAELEMPEARTAVALVHRGPEPAHFGGTLPQFASVGFVGFEDLACHAEWRLVFEIRSRGVLQRSLLFGEVEVHDSQLRFLVPIYHGRGPGWGRRIRAWMRRPILACCLRTLRLARARFSLGHRQKGREA